MRQKKDIGKLFENKLNYGKKNPSKALWVKIDTSLEAERRRNRNNFYYWLVGGGITLGLGLILIINEANLLNKSPNQEINIPLVEHPNNTSEEEINKNSVMNTSEELINVQDMEEQQLTKFEISPKDSISEELKTKEAQTINNAKKKKVKFEDEEYIVSKNYYYYNSKDGKQIITTNKIEIDSLISETKKTNDTRNSEITD